MVKKAKNSRPEVQLEDYPSLEAAANAVGYAGLVVLCRGSWNSWHAHPKGVVVSRGTEEKTSLLLNGHESLYRGRCKWWTVHPWGVDVRWWSDGVTCYWLNGQLLFQGPVIGGEAHPQGVVVHLPSHNLHHRFQLNDKLLYEGPCDEWQVHPRGLVVRIMDPATREWQYLLNGTDLLYQGWFSDWFSHPRGVVLVDCGKRYLLDGRELLGEGFFYYKGDVLRTQEGFVARRGKRFIEYPGGKLLCQGACDSWSVHPHGVLMRRGRKLLLNGRQPPLYDRYISYGNWESHELGVIVGENSRIVLAVGRPNDPFGPHPGLVVPDWIEEL